MEGKCIMYSFLNLHVNLFFYLRAVRGKGDENVEEAENDETINTPTQHFSEPSR